MIILSDSNNNVLGSYLDGTTVTNLTGITMPQNTLAEQDGVNAVLTINPSNNNSLQWVYQAIGSTLTDVQNSKLAQNLFLYNQALTKGFSSNASGSTLNYNYSADSQTLFMKLILGVTANIITFPYPINDDTGKSFSYSQAQIGQLIKDLTAFESNLQAKKVAYESQIRACASIAAVNDITISY
jgi:hypothetical protein